MNHLKMVHLLMEQTIRPDDHVLDMTLGNGHDMKKLLSCLEDGAKLTGYDISESALTTCRSIAEQYPEITADLRLDSHEHCENVDPFRFAVYNLGYLPGSDKKVTTRAASTIASLKTLLPKLLPDGMICVTAYRTHDGAEEANALRDWLLSQKEVSVRSWQRLPDDGHAPILYVLYKEERP